MLTRSFALSSLTVHPPQSPRATRARAQAGSPRRRGERTRLWRAIHALRFTLYGLLFALCLCFLPVLASAAEISSGVRADLKQVTILKHPESPRGAVTRKTEEIFLVEVVRDLQGLKKGLSQRQSMPEGHGMLFLLDAAKEHAFWMKGMKFPLDIIFIGEDRKITEILENLQPCEECPVYFPKIRPAYALELNAGLSKRLGIAIGDTLVINK